MANADFARGLVPVRNAAGGLYNCAARAYTARSDYAQALFGGDPVVVRIGYSCNPATAPQAKARAEPDAPSSGINAG